MFYLVQFTEFNQVGPVSCGDGIRYFTPVFCRKHFWNLEHLMSLIRTALNTAHCANIMHVLVHVYPLESPGGIFILELKKFKASFPRDSHLGASRPATVFGEFDGIRGLNTTEHTQVDRSNHREHWWIWTMGWDSEWRRLKHVEKVNSELPSIRLGVFHSLTYKDPHSARYEHICLEQVYFVLRFHLWKSFCGHLRTRPNHRFRVVLIKISYQENLCTKWSA